MRFKKNKKEPPKLTNRNVDIANGLDNQQIEDRISKGFVNEVKVGASKSVGKIFASNIFTFFNFLIALIFLWLVSVADTFEDLKNMTFMVIVVGNTGIGILQELKAKAKLDELSLLSSPVVKALRNGEYKEIKLNEILLDDVIALQAG